MRALRSVFVLAAVVALLASGVGATVAAFSDTTANGGNSMTAKRIFPGVRSTTGWTISDAADGSAASASDPTASADGTYWQSTNFSNAFTSTRYVTFDGAGTLPAGLSTSSVALRLDYSSSGASTMCFWFEVVRVSTSTVIGTHGSTASPATCVTGTTITAANIAMPEVSSTDIANDVTIKLYGRESAGRAVRVDRVAITGSTPYDGFTLYRDSSVDAADGSAATLVWAIATQDTNYFQNSNNWPSAFGATRFIDVTFPSGHVPTGSTINSAALGMRFKAQQNAKALCLYYEVYSSGGTLLGTYGSSASPYCSDTANNWRADAVSLPAVDTVAEANGLRVRIFGQVAAGGAGLFDLIELRTNYHLD